VELVGFEPTTHRSNRLALPLRTAPCLLFYVSTSEKNTLGKI
jgi:hypothetical protein